MADELDASEPPIVMTVRQFDRETQLPAGYRTSFDLDKCCQVASALFEQIGELVTVEKQIIEMSIAEAAIELKREDGSSLDIQCYGADVFDLVWWPSSEEALRQGKIRFETAPELEVGTMRMLTYRYVTRGNLREEDA